MKEKTITLGAVALALVLILLSACTEDNAVYNPTGDGAPNTDAPHGDAKHLNVCTPNEFVKCVSTKVLLRCNVTGTAEVQVDCSPAVCDAAAKRCSECDPASAPTCSGDTLTSCSINGLLVKVTCPNGCQSGKCTSCTPQTFYQDADNDGWGNDASPATACSKPAGYATNKGDCDDLDASAHPSQKAYFTFATKGNGDFDYDCDDHEEQQYPSAASCSLKGNNCVGDGWSGTVPACGKEGQFVDCLKQSGGSTGCTQTVTKKIQACQ